MERQSPKSLKTTGKSPSRKSLTRQRRSLSPKGSPKSQRKSPKGSRISPSQMKRMQDLLERQREYENAVQTRRLNSYYGQITTKIQNAMNQQRYAMVQNLQKTKQK